MHFDRFRQFWPEFDQLRDAGQSVLEGGPALQLAQEFCPLGGAPSAVKRCALFPIRSGNGDIGYLGLLAMDLTDQQASQQELTRSRGTLQAFFDNVPAMTFIISRDRRYVSANSYALDSYGFAFLSPENLIGNPDTTGTPEHWHPTIEEAHRTVVEEGRAHVVETSIELPGNSLDLSVSRFPIRNDEGEVTHVGGLIFDRTAERRAAKEIAATREALHQSEKLAALGQLLAGVAHELNNPLTVVVGRSAILEEKLRDTPNAKAISALREAADRCNRIVRTFLAMARQSAPRRGPVQINDAIEAAIDMTAYGMRSSGIELVRAFDPALPEAEADEDQMVQVFTNLLINARHALEALDRPTRITIATRAADGMAIATFADNGTGVPPQIASRIFEPFFTTKGVGEGTGMGLAMAKGMIEEHGGELTYADTAGGGATFTVAVPLGTARALPASGEAPAQPAATARGRVLIVDDEAPIRMLLAEILEGIALDCVQCGDGETALEALEAGGFDLVFCDLRMPVMDGIRFREQLALRHPHMLDRLVFISGDVLQRAAGRNAAIAGHAYIEKPFNPAEVRALALGKLGIEGAGE